LIQVVCDLDGVVYRGRRVLPGVPEAITRLREAGGRILFVTNNSTRTPGQAAAHIAEMTGVPCSADEVCTSPQAAVMMLGVDDAPAFVVGEEGISEVLLEAAVPVATDADEANSVVVGLSVRIDYRWLSDAADAVRRGARFIATNTDPTYPTEHGLLPGAGAIVAAISTASGREPEVAGKPHPPMVELVRSRLDPGPVWVVGDRVDTDMSLARAGGWTAVLVRGGVTIDPKAGVDCDYAADGLADAVDLILGRS
jgi:glycerol-1-phosphatase